MLDSELLDSLELSKPLVFVFGYALARLLMSWRIIASKMIGFGFGDYAAACLSRMIALEDALRLIIIRSR